MRKRDGGGGGCVVVCITPTVHRRLSSGVTGCTGLHPRAVLTSEVTVVGRHHQQVSLGVLDYVTPVDGVCMAQEYVLVHVHPPIQDLCKEREK